MADYEVLTETIVNLKGELEKQNEEKEKALSDQFVQVWKRARDNRDERWLMEPLEAALGDVQTVLKELYSFKIKIISANDVNFF